MLPRLFAAALLSVAALPASAESFSRISDRSDFIEAVQDTEFRCRSKKMAKSVVAHWAGM